MAKNHIELKDTMDIKDIMKIERTMDIKGIDIIGIEGMMDTLKNTGGILNEN